jgi:translocation and assembly module TamB
MVTGQDQSVELRAHLDGTLRGGDVTLAGGVESISGFIMLFGRRYDIVHANLSFDTGDKPGNPRLDIRLAHEFRTATVYIDVTGRLEKPRLMLSSDPGSYDQAQLLGFVLGGDPDDPAIGQTDVGSKAVGVASTVLLGQVQQQLKSALPLDVLSVQVGEGTDANTTRLEVGKWVNERFFVGYRARINAPDTKNENEVSVQYRLARRWLVDAFFGDRGVGGADVLWTKRF